jgi:MSHA biogenesis protein MshE
MDRPVAPFLNPQRFRLGEVLVSQGLIDEAQLAQALAHQQRSGRKLGHALIDLRLVSEAQICEVVARQLGIAYVDLMRHRLDPEQVRRLSETQARRFRAVVLGPKAGGVEVGLVDPADLVSLDQLARVLGQPVLPAVVSEEALLATIERIYQRKEAMASLARDVAADVGGASAVSGVDLEASGDDAPVVRLLQTIFQAAVAREASDIHIEPQEAALQIRFRVDGAMQVQSTPDARIAGAVVQRIKLLAALDIAEKRLPQDGRFRVKVSDTTLDVRVSTLPTQHGESVVMRLLAAHPQRSRLDAIGMPEAILARLRAALAGSSGLVLVTGPTGSGKTTTLYACLTEINAPDIKIITVEDPVEYRLPGLNQVQVNDKVELGFARVLRACLRQDPDVILVGEMRDTETAEIGLRASLTGHIVLSTLHTNDAASAPMRLRDMGVAPFMVASGLRLIIAQRLVRRICAACREPADAGAHEAEWLGADLRQADGRYRVFRGCGCNACHHSGYQGRLAVYEMVEMTPELVRLANADDPGAFVARARSDFAEHTLRRHALALLAAGETTVAEAMRVALADAGD